MVDDARDDRDSPTGVKPGRHRRRPDRGRRPSGISSPSCGGVTSSGCDRLRRVRLAVLQASEPIIHGATWRIGSDGGAADARAWVPVALILAWVYDLTRQGVTRRPPPPARRGTSPRRLAVLLIGAGLWGLSGDRLVRWKWHGERGGASGAQKESPSIAVLPFADLSPPKDQDYSPKGVAGEILDALSRVRGLRVPGRSLSFWFKGRNVEPAEIARKLGVTHLLEGTVQRSGSKVRIPRRS